MVTQPIRILFSEAHGERLKASGSGAEVPCTKWAAELKPRGFQIDPVLGSLTLNINNRLHEPDSFCELIR